MAVPNVNVAAFKKQKKDKPLSSFHTSNTQLLYTKISYIKIFNLKKIYSAKAMSGSPVELSEELVTQEKRKKGWRMNCDVGEATEVLENELLCR